MYVDMIKDKIPAMTITPVKSIPMQILANTLPSLASWKIGRPVKFSDVLFDSGSILIMESQFEKFMLILVFFQIHKWCEYLSLYFFFILRPINLNTFFQIKNRNSVSVSMEFLLYLQTGDKFKFKAWKS